jgi:hypothetical protein
MDWTIESPNLRLESDGMLALLAQRANIVR